MAQLILPDVTLCAVETRAIGPVSMAMRRCMDAVRFGDVVLFSPDPADFDAGAVRHVPIRGFADIAAYSDFMLTAVHSHITTSHVLFVQWDGFILNPAAWDEAFLHQDYVGAVWPQFADGMSVGNGGFSLRSRRLLQALQDPEFKRHHPEDVAICRTNRSMLEGRFGLKFAPEALARRFAFEREAPGGAMPFGFHGLFNFDIACGADLGAVLDALPIGLLGNRDARDLARKLVHSPDRMHRRIGRRLIRRRITQTPLDRRDWAILLGLT